MSVLKLTAMFELKTQTQSFPKLCSLHSTTSQNMIFHKSNPHLHPIVLTIFISTCLTVTVTSLREPVYRRNRYNYNTQRQTADYNEGGIPSGMPSPPEHEDKPGPTTMSPVKEVDTEQQPAPQQHQQQQQRPIQFDSMDDGPVGPNDVFQYHYYYGMEPDPEVTVTTSAPVKTENAKPEEDDDDDEDEDKEPAPFGFEETILILVPQVKYKIHNLPKWFGASFKLSYPITIFFDELDWPKPEEGFKILGLPFSKYQAYQAPTFMDMKRRRGRSVMSLPPESSFPGMDRANLIPKLEKTLKTYGLGGKACLLRSVCEVHEAELLERYGFLGEMLTRIFTISNSAYAETHLPGYLKAERRGKAGNCSSYFRRCELSLFQGNSEYCEKGVKNC